MGDVEAAFAAVARAVAQEHMISHEGHRGVAVPAVGVVFQPSRVRCADQFRFEEARNIATMGARFGKSFVGSKKQWSAQRTLLGLLL